MANQTQRNISALLFVGGLLVCVLAFLTFHILRVREEQAIRADLAKEATIISRALQEICNTPLRYASSLASIFAMSGEISHQQLVDLAWPLKGQSDALAAIVWAPRVLHSERKHFETRMRQGGFADFQIRQIADNGSLVAAASQGDYYPVRALEPDRQQHRILGFDFASEKVRAKTMALARDTGQPAATSRIAFITDRADKSGILFFSPIYRNGTENRSLTERRRNISGFLVTAHRLAPLLKAALRFGSDQDIRIVLIDASQGGAPDLLTCNTCLGRQASLDRAAIEAIRSQSVHHENIQVADRIWELHLSPGASFTAARRNTVSILLPLIILLTGTGLLALLYFYIRQSTTVQTQAVALKGYAERLGILHAIDQAILASKPTEEIARTAIEALQATIPCAGFCVYLFDFSKKETIPLASVGKEGFPLYADPKLAFRCPNFIDGLRQGVLSKGCSHQALEECLISLALLEKRFTSSITIPLKTEDGLIGALSVFSESQACCRDIATREILQEVAIQLANPIQNTRLQLDLSDHREQLKRLSLGLIKAEEAQRRRIALDLHDKVGQELTALGINLNIIEGHLPPDCDQLLSSRLADSSSLVEEITEQVRDIMADLRPPVLDDYGINAAIRWYAPLFSARSGIEVIFTGREIPRCEPTLEIALFRIVQEALTNVAKHSGASKVIIHSLIRNQSASLSIADNGCGLAPTDQTGDADSRQGIGLVSMRERLEVFGGKVEFKSLVGQGLTITVRVKV